VAHSYGGIPASQAVMRVNSSVERLVLVDGWLAPAGASLVDVAPEWFRDWCRSSASGEPPMLPLPPLWTIGITDGSPEADWLSPRLVEQPLATFTDPCDVTVDSTELDLRGIDRHAVLCLPASLPFKELAVDAGCHLHEIESGHDVMVTRPDAIANLLHHIVS
jgi:pimeloyl-ACP methyl ester carboxylesterase